MELVKGYSDSREEEEEEEAAEEEEIITREEESSSKHHCPFSSPSLSLSSSPSITNYTTTTTTTTHPHHHHHHHHHNHVINVPHQQNPWLGMIHGDHHQSPEATESHNSSSGLGLLQHQQHHHQDAASNSTTNHTTLKQLDFMELSLGNDNNNKDAIASDEANFQHGSGSAAPPPLYAHAVATVPGGSSSSSAAGNQPTEKEHMFDKVVTPSDVGKLNRLVIPKQHAEKYFPLDSTANEKGLLLNFEDRNGKLWRFRYSYWNSSQSYVMTKGWSRFVKEKKLDAGDIVSFQRGVGELYRHRLYIDWRRRSNHNNIHEYQYHHPVEYPSSTPTTLFTPFFLPNQPLPAHLSSQYSMIRWGSSATTSAATGRLYSLPSPQLPPRHLHHHDPLQQQQQHLNYNYHMYPFHNHHGGGGSHHHHYNYHHDHNPLSTSGSAGGSVYYLRSAPPPSMPMADTIARQQQEGGGVNIAAPMIIDSVPVSHHHHYHHGGGGKGGSSSSSSPKRLRLFGVNMECGSSSSPSEEDPKCCSLLSSTSVAHVTMANNSLPSSSSLPPLHQRLRVPHEDTLSSPSTRFGDQRGEASMLFDLDPSLQYRL